MVCLKFLYSEYSIIAENSSGSFRTVSQGSHAGTMKRLFTKRIETIDFKAFCASGSPEFVAAKQKLNSLYQKHQQNSLINRLFHPYQSSRIL
jgi:hypothetical protein